ncbi:MAG: diguanylate cyclase [Gammaproteobacteria bacterium]|nr:diguanylate cyclase [Gammaproteobacteria bacterium]
MESGPLHRRTSRIAVLLIATIAMAVPVLGTGWSGDDGLVPLDDGWWFRAGDDPGWAAPDLDHADWERVDLPHVWAEGGHPGHRQRGWYRRVVELPGPVAGDRLLALRMGTVRNAYRLYLDGRPVGGVGALPPDPRVNHDRVRIQPIPPELLEDGRLVIAVRVWGGSDLAVVTAGAGFHSGPVLLGDHGELVRRPDGRGHAEADPGDPVRCHRSLFPLPVRSQPRTAAPFLVRPDGAAAGPAHAHPDPVEAPVRAVLRSPGEDRERQPFPGPRVPDRAGLGGTRRPADWWMRLFQALFLGFSLVLLAIPGLEIHYLIRPAWQAASLALVLPMSWVIGNAALHGSRSGRILGLALLAFIAFAVNDLLVNMGVMDGIRLIPVGFLGVLVAMGVILADRFSGLLESLETQVALVPAPGNWRPANDALAAANERLRLRSRIDPLTDLLNRRGFVAEVEAERNRVDRGAQAFGLLLLDVDFFKRFNDDHGHACGDQVLCEVARVLETQTREVDRVGRWGGEEFLILLPETDVEGLARVAEKLRAAIAARVVECEGRQLGVTATFGAALLRDGETFEACLERADQALYFGKDNGRNRVELADG